LQFPVILCIFFLEAVYTTSIYFQTAMTSVNENLMKIKSIFQNLRLLSTVMRSRCDVFAPDSRDM
jgi:hypothetical protein